MPVRPRTLATTLAVASALLVAAHVVVFALYGPGSPRRFDLVRFFSLDFESTLPSWLSASALLLAALYALAIARADDIRSASSRRRWLGLAVLLTVLSLDESAAIHERATVPLRSALDAEGPLHFAWVIPGLIFVAVVVAVYWRFVMRLPPPTRRLVLVGGAVYVAGALLVEFAAGAYVSGTSTRASWTYQLLVVTEEGLELAGITTLIYALAGHLDRQAPALG